MFTMFAKGINPERRIVIVLYTTRGVSPWWTVERIRPGRQDVDCVACELFTGHRSTFLSFLVSFCFMVYKGKYESLNTDPCQYILWIKNSSPPVKSDGVAVLLKPVEANQTLSWESGSHYVKMNNANYWLLLKRESYTLKNREKKWWIISAVSVLVTLDLKQASDDWSFN